MLFGFLAIYFLVLRNVYSYEFPFSTKDNSIIDANNTIVRMKCVNWPGGMETLMPEGLQHNSIENIVLLIKEMNMTCVRLSYSVDVTLSPNLTAYQSLARLNLTSAIQGFISNNPLLINTSISNIFEAVLNTLGKYNMLVLLDNWVSRAMWCCSSDDGNGFWGDQYFDVDQWTNSLRFMAEKAVDRPYVIAMSLRNELRGPRQNQADWYRYVQQGVEVVSSVNPQILILISGLNYDLDLTFIRYKSVQDLVPQSIRNKLVYEAHWYSWSHYDPSDDCNKTIAGVQNAWGFILEANHSYTAPVWLTEFGTNVDNFTGDDTFIDCVKSFLQTPLANTMSWSYWVFGGTYYIRSGQIELHDAFSLLTDDWKQIKSKPFIAALSTL